MRMLRVKYNKLFVTDNTKIACIHRQIGRVIMELKEIGRASCRERV